MGGRKRALPGRGRDRRRGEEAAPGPAADPVRESRGTRAGKTPAPAKLFVIIISAELFSAQIFEVLILRRIPLFGGISKHEFGQGLGKNERS